MPSKYGFGNTRKKSPYKMKGFSGFGNSPAKQSEGFGPHNPDKPKLPKAKSMSTQTAPVITPTIGELVDPHHQMEGYGAKKEFKTLSTSKKNILKSLVDFVKSSKKK